MEGDVVKTVQQAPQQVSTRVANEQDIKQQLRLVRESIRNEPKGTSAYLAGHFIHAR
ncbi:hypothetical protein SAMN04488075_2890 [Paracoccus alkenifer]|uniref:Uncharacterized protein n=1 Tax=Paracoccus alkenifer TaxID=65735 RepID=A0A1H6N6L0_9RHOB|nr:hypothetical protein SAMN04488075_2890 [Paracoccus alkenifer]